MKAVTIFPYFEALIHSFCIQGLRSSFGTKSITYSTDGFPRFGSSGFLKFIVHGETDRRIFIDHWDFPELDEPGLAWCNVYAKINIDPNLVPENYAPKIIPTGPIFPVRLYRLIPTLYHALETSCLSAKSSRDYFDYNRIRGHFANWYGQFKYAPPQHAYEPGVSTKNYIFFPSSLWKNAIETNVSRALFIEACRSITGIRFEGGFTPRSEKDVRGYEHLTMDKRYTHTEFIQKTKASAVVFITPAVARCLSWRLGEYLALGKAIVATPIERLLPAPLIHGKHIHYVEASLESIKNAVQLICQDDAYRRKLEQGAREYYLE